MQVSVTCPSGEADCQLPLTAIRATVGVKNEPLVTRQYLHGAEHMSLLMQERGPRLYIIKNNKRHPPLITGVPDYTTEHLLRVTGKQAATRDPGVGLGGGPSLGSKVSRLPGDAAGS